MPCFNILSADNFSLRSMVDIVNSGNWWHASTYRCRHIMWN